MSRVVAYIDCNPNGFLNLEADEFHEDEGFIKVYNRSECVAMLRPSEVRAIYRSGAEAK